MVRYRLHGEIKYSKFREALEIWKQIGALTLKRGWPKLTVWFPSRRPGQPDDRGR